MTNVFKGSGGYDVAYTIDGNSIYANSYGHGDVAYRIDGNKIYKGAGGYDVAYTIDGNNIYANSYGYGDVAYRIDGNKIYKGAGGYDVAYRIGYDNTSSSSQVNSIDSSTSYGDSNSSCQMEEYLTATDQKRKENAKARAEFKQWNIKRLREKYGNFSDEELERKDEYERKIDYLRKCFGYSLSEVELFAKLRESAQKRNRTEKVSPLIATLFGLALFIGGVILEHYFFGIINGIMVCTLLWLGLMNDTKRSVLLAILGSVIIVGGSLIGIYIRHPIIAGIISILISLICWSNMGLKGLLEEKNPTIFNYMANDWVDKYTSQRIKLKDMESLKATYYYNIKN